MQSGMEHAIWKSLIVPSYQDFRVCFWCWSGFGSPSSQPQIIRLQSSKYGGFRTWIMYKYNTSKLKPRQTGVIPFNTFHQTSNSKLDNRLHSDRRTSRTVTDESRDPRPLAVPSFHIYWFGWSEIQRNHEKSRYHQKQSPSICSMCYSKYHLHSHPSWSDLFIDFEGIILP